MRKILLAVAVMAILGVAAINFAFMAEPAEIDAVAVHYAFVRALESDSAQQATAIQVAFLSEILAERQAAITARDRCLQGFLYAFLVAVGLLGGGLRLYYERTILLPFRKLKTFANAVAAGNLDAPLAMDKGNIFGAFSESFDLMREELKIARERENQANKSKKELVISLVHDITTPVASVRSAMDILRLKMGKNDESTIKILDSVDKKLVQIAQLMGDMFNSTLEELQELKVNTLEIPSTEICEQLKQADFEKRAAEFYVPQCLVLADSLRL